MNQSTGRIGIGYPVCVPARAYHQVVPLIPNNGKLIIELDGAVAVSELIETARRIDPEMTEKSFSAERRIVADIEDHLL